jgi:hypothetical protein
MQTSQAYETNMAAQAAGIDVATLRTWQRQGVIQYCGEEPRPSYPRAYPLAGVYEMALFRAMTGHGIARNLAMHLVRGEISKWLAVDGAETPDLLRGTYRRVKRVMTEYRDIANPAVLVIGVDDSNPDDPIPCGVEYAQGWSNTQQAIVALQTSGKPHPLPSVPWGGEPIRNTPGRPFTVIHLVDVTSVLAGVDARLANASKP